MIRLVLIAAVLAVVGVFVFHPEPRRLLRPRPRTVAVLLAGVLVLLALTGRLHWLIALGTWVVGTAKWWLWPLIRLAPTLWARWRSRPAGEEGARQGQAPSPDGAMSAEQARRILGVDAGADREAVIAAHRQLVQRLHPDRGGSDYLTAQLNEAKEVLLAERRA